MAFALPTLPIADVRALLERDGPTAVALELLSLHAVEVTEALETLDADDRLRVAKALPVNVTAEVLLQADAELRSALLSDLPATQIAQILDRLPIEQAASLLEEMDDERQRAVLAASSPQDAARMRAIHDAPASSVARLMVRQIPRITADMSVAETFRYLRRSSAQIGAFHNIYVVDENASLIGVVALRELVLADPNARVGDLMQARVVAVTPETDREEAANLISRYNFLALPVVDANRRLLGIVTVDDLVDVMIKEQTEDVLALGGVSGGDEEENASYWAGRLMSVVKKRIVWLLLLFVAGTLTGSVLRYFDDALSRMTALAFFIPLLIGTGGNAGSQTVATIVRGLAVGEIRLRDSLRVAIREASTGLVLGVLLGLVGVARAYFWGADWRLGVTVGISLAAVCLWANLVGSLIPLLAKRLRLDPTLVSAPLITTIVDATGLLIYFGIARGVMGV